MCAMFQVWLLLKDKQSLKSIVPEEDKASKRAQQTHLALDNSSC